MSKSLMDQFDPLINFSTPPQTKSSGLDLGTLIDLFGLNQKPKVSRETESSRKSVFKEFQFEYFSVKLANTSLGIDFLVEEINELSPTLMGLDTETTIIYGADDTSKFANMTQKVSVLTLSVETKIYIFQLWRAYQNSTLPASLKKLLANNKIAKVGAAIDLDQGKLLSSYGLKTATSLDLQSIAVSLAIPQISLGDLAEKFCPEFPKLKSKLGNWDGDLSADQVLYAANDAYIGVKIYHKMITPVLLKCPTSTVPLKLSREEYLDLLKILPTVFPFGKSTDRQKIFNYLNNSYGPWAKTLSSSQKEQKINILFEQMKADRVIEEDSFTGKIKIKGFKLKFQSEQPNSEALTILNEVKNSIHNIKISSAINYLTNSYGPWRNTISLEHNRKKKAAQILQELVKLGKIELYGPKKKIIVKELI